MGAGEQVPISSRHDPAYLDSEQKRDAEAEEYLKQLAAKEAKKRAARRAAAKLPAGGHTHVQRRHQDRTALAEKYLKIMEKQALDKQTPAAKAQDRNLMAEKYLRELRSKKRGGRASAPQGSRHNAAYLKGEHARDKQAALDMALLGNFLQSDACAATTSLDLSEYNIRLEHLKALLPGLSRSRITSLK